MVIRKIEDAYNFGEKMWGIKGLEQRVLLYTNNLMVVWLKIPPRTEFPDHSHFNEQIGIQIAGYCELRGKDGKVEIGPGTAYMFEPGEIHGSRVLGDEPVIQIDVFHPARQDYLEQSGLK